MKKEEEEACVVAGIDCGTNSIRLKISRVTASGDVYDIVPRVMRIIRLGENVDATGRFSDDSLKRLQAALEEFSVILTQHSVDFLRFVATSASRDVANRKDFARIISSTLGVLPEVISGNEEARLSFLAATHYLPMSSQSPYLVFDLGGGSTELVLGARNSNNPRCTVDASYSMNIGSVRMTERYLHDDPCTVRQVHNAIADIDANIEQAFQSVQVHKAHTIVGVSGTVTTIAALSLGLQEYDHTKLQGVTIPIDSLLSTSEKFLYMTKKDRAQYKTIHPGRIDVLGGGALVLSRLLTHLANMVQRHEQRVLDTCIVSEHGLLDGIVLDAGLRILSV